jgi:uncharacterized protein YndB with AHSA1/START domain
MMGNSTFSKKSSVAESPGGLPSSSSQSFEKSETREISIIRFFDAPRELVFRAWTDPEHLVSWFAPNGCTIHFKNLDIREGGVFHSCVRTPTGYECWCRGVYHEITPSQRIVLTMAMANSNGDFVEPAYIGMDPDWPRETILTVTFDDEGERTKLTLHQTVREALAKRTGAYPGWIEMLDKLDEELRKAG